MGEVIIVFVTMISIIILAVRNRRMKKDTKKSIVELFKGINSSYIDVLKEKSFFSKIIQLTLIVFGGITSFVSIYSGISINIKFENKILEGGLKIILLLIALIIVHYAIGYILYISLKIQSFIIKVENKNLKIDFLISYFLISTYLAVSIVFPKAFTENLALGLTGMIICYYLNMKTLITLMVNPVNVKGSKEEESLFRRIIVAAILILFMLILNLYLMVCLVGSANPSAFTNAQGKFDLFYYTIITFSTIGYGDIVPNIFLAKVISILISVTSVVCISVFLSSILSYKEELSK
ncbi:two pore domain potassium channel family protein [Clostridium perfringens]|nr:two pore domain potassium channel family protein [Clostridium perfringens]